MKGLSGKRKLSFLGTGINFAFMEIKYPIYIKRGTILLLESFKIPWHYLYPFLSIFMVFREQPGQSVFPWSSESVSVIMELNNSVSVICFQNS